MACLLTCLTDVGFIPSCTAQPGGNKLKMWIIPRCKIETYTYTGDIITNITLTVPVADRFYEVIVERDSLVTTETGVYPNRIYQQTVSFRINQLSSAVGLEQAAFDQKEFLEKLTANLEGVTIIIEDKVDNGATGIRRIYGHQVGLLVTAMEKTSGTASTDIAGTVVTLSEVQSVLAPVLANTYVIDVV